LRGFKNRYRVAYQVLNVADLNELPANSSLTIAELIASGLIKASQPVKLLGDGELTVALTVQVHKASASAKQKVEAAGGTVIEKPWVLVRPTRSFGLHPSARGTRE
jgi:large subunit ribosomal protein L15